MPGPFDAILRDARRPVAPAKLPGRNQPCWCGSKQKYKKCRLDRDTQPQADIFGFTKRADKARKRGSCLYPVFDGPCGKPAISSHTVQKRGGLAAIAENGHVLTTMVGFIDLVKTGARPTPQRVGIKEASTFPGFCASHDSGTFSLIEQEDAAVSFQSAFLFYYRALCLELVRKRHALQTTEKLLGMDAGLPIDRQVHMQSIVSSATTGLRLGISELEKYKLEADANLLQQRWEAIRYCFVQFDSVLPIVTAFAIQQEYDWQGSRLQYLGNLTHILDVVSISITSYNGASWAIFAWPEASGTADRFVSSFLSIDPSQMAERLVAACFDLAENNYIDPRWWRGISQASRDALSGQIMSGVEDLHSAEGMQKRAELLRPVAVANIIQWRD